MNHSQQEENKKINKEHFINEVNNENKIIHFSCKYIKIRIPS